MELMIGCFDHVKLDLIFYFTSKDNMFPDADTPNQLHDGVKFSDLPICYIKVSKNNSILHLVNTRGEKIAYRSCGMDGFKNTRKGTNIAAQTTAIKLAEVAYLSNIYPTYMFQIG